MARILVFGTVAVVLTGCAGVHFSDAPESNALKFYETVPALLVTVDSECKPSAQLVSLPGKERYISFRPGLGKSETAVTFGNGGIIQSLTAKREGAVDDALKIANAVMGAAAFHGEESGGGASPAKPACRPTLLAYRIQPDGAVTADPTPLFVQALTDAMTRAQSQHP